MFTQTCVTAALPLVTMRIMFFRAGASGPFYFGQAQKGISVFLKFRMSCSNGYQIAITNVISTATTNRNNRPTDHDPHFLGSKVPGKRVREKRTDQC